MDAPVPVLQKQPGPIEDQRLHWNILLHSQLFQLPTEFRRNIHLDIHGFNGIAD